MMEMKTGIIAKGGGVFTIDTLRFGLNQSSWTENLGCLVQVNERHKTQSTE